MSLNPNVLYSFTGPRETSVGPGCGHTTLNPPTCAFLYILVAVKKKDSPFKKCVKLVLTKTQKILTQRSHMIGWVCVVIKQSPSLLT